RRVMRQGEVPMPMSRSLVLQAAAAVVLTLALVWAATQWAAAMLGHQPALGPPWIGLCGVSVYAPWKLFPWWIAFDAQAPEVFHRAGLLALAGGVVPALVAIGGAAWRSRAQTVKTTYGSARWAALADVREAGLLTPRGVVLGLFNDAYLRHDGPEHVLAVAP